MPTGYTAIIDDNENVTFEQYVWRCARGIGALIMMRDEGFDAPIPEKFEPSDFYANALAKARKDLEEIQSLSDEECEARARKEYEEQIAHNAESVTEETATTARYDAMTQAVLDWTPPTPEHAGLKEFMLEQLRTGRPYQYTPTEPQRLTGEQWKMRQAGKLFSKIQDYTEENAKEIERTNGRNEWIEKLRQSVPDPNTNRSKQAEA